MGKAQSCGRRGIGTVLRLQGDKYSFAVAGGKQQPCDCRGRGKEPVRLHGVKHSLAVTTLLWSQGDKYAFAVAGG